MKLKELKQIKLKGGDKKIMKTKIRQDSGITLIALVITIVVLLILAGVSINAILSDNGIIKRAQDAQNKMNEAQQNDLTAINELSNWLDSKVNENTGDKIIKFTTSLTSDNITIEYEATEGMTWEEWLESDYSKSNSNVKFTNNTSNITYVCTNITRAGYILIGNSQVKPSDTIIENMQYIMASCLAKGTLIEVEEEEEDENGKKKKRRRKKKIEDLTYNDNLVVWNFDEGKFDTAKPLWLMKEHKTICYNLLKFSDGSELKTIEQHRIFNKELGKFTYPMTDETPVGTTTFNVNGEEVKLISKEVITEPVEYYNLISYYHMNVFAEGILTSCRFNNLYEIEDMKFIKDERELVNRDEYKEIPDEYYYGLRLAEQPKEINRGNDDKHYNSITEYIKGILAIAKSRE